MHRSAVRKARLLEGKDQVTMNYEAASYRPLLAVGDILGEGDKGVVGLVA